MNIKIRYFFVVTLKFPPIVQSGSILFRELDLGEEGLSAYPLPFSSVIGLGAHVCPMTSLHLQRWPNVLQLLIN